MITKELQTLWWDWLGTSERLLRVLHEQTAALVLRDVDRVSGIQPDLDKLINLLQSIDEKAVACARKLAEDLGTEPHLRSLVQVLEKAEAMQLQGLANRVTAASRNVTNVLDKNRALLQNEMTYINGTLTLLARANAEAQNPYPNRSRAPRRAVVQTNISVDTAA